MTAVSPLTPLVSAESFKLSVQQAYLGALRCMTPVREEPLNSNAGQMVEAFQKACGGKKGDSWCLQVLMFVGWHMFRSRWSLRMTGSTNECADDAKARGLRFLPSEAEPGDIALLWSAKKGRFYHAVALVQLLGDRWDTLEGNTNRGGSANGYGFFAREGDDGRILTPKCRVVKWHRGLQG